MRVCARSGCPAELDLKSRAFVIALLLHCPWVLWTWSFASLLLTCLLASHFLDGSVSWIYLLWHGWHWSFVEVDTQCLPFRAVSWHRLRSRTTSSITTYSCIQIDFSWGLGTSMYIYRSIIISWATPSAGGWHPQKCQIHMRPCFLSKYGKNSDPEGSGQGRSVLVFSFGGGFKF